MHFPDGIYSFKANNRITRIMCETHSKSIIKTSELHQWRLGSNFKILTNNVYLRITFIVFLMSYIRYSQLAFTCLKLTIETPRARYEICSKLTIKTPERHQWHRSGVFIVNFEHISHLALVFLLLTLNMQLPAGFRFHPFHWSKSSVINANINKYNAI